MIPFFRSSGVVRDYLLVMSLLALVAGGCFFVLPFIGYKAVALILLLLVSLVAMLFRLGPVILAATISALVWDFFFIPPTFTFTVGSVDDSLFLLMYFVIALISGVSTFRFRQLEKREHERQQQENAIKLYNTLFNSLSHELQTPLATIIGATDTIKESKLDQHQRNELMSTISEAALRLTAQVDGLLNISRLESGFLQAKTDWTDLGELLHNPVNQLETGDKNIEVLVPQGAPLVKLDQHLIEQVIFNLVNNAVLHTPEKTSIKVSAELTPYYWGEIDEEGAHPKAVANNLVISISDNGPGFPKEEQQKVFDKFYRLENTLNKGNGLGLSIAKGFVEAHAGTIELFDSLQGGAEFRITIPVEVSYFNKVKHE